MDGRELLGVVCVQCKYFKIVLVTGVSVCITQSSLLSGLEKWFEGADANYPNKHLFPPPAGWVDCPLLPTSSRGPGRRGVCSQVGTRWVGVGGVCGVCVVWCVCGMCVVCVCVCEGCVWCVWVWCGVCVVWYVCVVCVWCGVVCVCVWCVWVCGCVWVCVFARVCARTGLVLLE